MNFKYNLMEEDYINFNIYRITIDENGISMLKKQRLTGAFSLLLMGALFVYFSNYAKFLISTFIIFLALFWYYNYPKLAKKRVVKATEKALSNKDISNFYEELDVSITTEGIVESDTLHPWGKINKCIVVDGTIYVFYDDTTTLIIPKRITHEYYDELLEIIKRSNCRLVTMQ